MKKRFARAPGALRNSGASSAGKDFPYGEAWNGKTYAIKQVRPVFVDEPEEMPRMKISYDAEVDALSITFRDTTVTTKHLAYKLATLPFPVVFGVFYQK